MSIESFLKLFDDHASIKKIDYRNIIDELTSFESILHKQLQDFEHTEHHTALMNELNDIKTILQNSKLKELHQYFDQIIKRREGNYLKKGYQAYENEFIHDSWDYILDNYKNQLMTADTLSKIYGSIGSNVNWKYPGLELSPGDGVFTKKLVALDPLYIIDKHPEILEHVTLQFNEAYQRRLRSYTLKYEADFNKLPQEQFGMIFSWGFFEQMPLDIIKDYLKAFYGLLRPGGVVLMSYNNCEFKPSLKLTSTYSRAYNTESFMQSLIHGLGFNDIESTNLYPNYSLLKFKKPGELTSQRSGQTMGEIKNII